MQKAATKKAIRKPSGKAAKKRSKKRRYSFSSGVNGIDEQKDIFKSNVISSAGRRAASGAMRTMGYVVVQEGEWIVKRFSSGKVARLKKIERSEIPQNFTLE